MAHVQGGQGRKSVKYQHAFAARFMGFLDYSLCGVIKKKKKKNLAILPEQLLYLTSAQRLLSYTASLDSVNLFLFIVLK